MPKSWLAGIGEVRLVRKLMIVVPAASPSGSMTPAKPFLAAARTGAPSARISR